MNDAARPTTFDFRKPRQLADDVERVLTSWREAFSALISDSWTQQLGLQATWKSGELETTRSGELMPQLPEAISAYDICIGDESASTWLILARPFALALVSAMLGDKVEQLPPDRALTAVEKSLIEFAVQLIEHCLTISQPCDDQLACSTLGSRRLQEMTRRFPAQEQVVVSHFEINCGFGSQPVWWVLSQASVLKLFSHISERRAALRDAIPRLEPIIRRIPLEVVVRLGQAKLHVSELMNLRPGDVVVLDQRVNEPLAIEVSGTTKYLGWPGRVGNRQAFQIQ